MLNLFKKNDKMVDGVLYIKQESLEQIIHDLVYIFVMLDLDENEIRAMRNSVTENGMTIALPITVTETIWKKLKKSGNIKLVATKEQMMKKSSMTMKMETALSI